MLELMADAKSLFHLLRLHIMWTPARRFVSHAFRHLCVLRQWKLHCSSDAGNTRFQPHGLTW